MPPNEKIINHKELLEQLLHELRTVSHVIKASSEELSKTTNSKKSESLNVQKIQHYSNIIFDNAYILSLWLDIADFESNPHFFMQQELSPRSLWGKFKKVTTSFKRIADPKKIKIKTKGESATHLDLYPVIDILPYLLIDNAVKYSPSGSLIEIIFNETNNEINILVSSMGPTLKPHELEKIFESGFRAESAQKTTIQGTGRGLALAKYICDIHDANIMATQGSTKFNFKNIEYGEFIISLSFKK